MKYSILLSLFISITLICGFNLPFDNNILLPRRDIMGSIIFANGNNQVFKSILTSIDKKNLDIKTKSDKIDYYAHWSIYGIIPPPIEKTILYSELVESIKNGTIKYIEIAVQHDCIVATTTNNHRWSCLLNDRHIPQLIEETRKPDGSEGIKIMPTQQYKNNIRNIGQVVFYTWIFRFLTLDMRYNYHLLKSARDQNMTIQETMHYLSNKTTNIDMTELLNTSWLNTKK
tara:strand:- start:48 stop:734 length:687 start_codon:yes stop_codon:yes gene_type:complete